MLKQILNINPPILPDQIEKFETRWSIKLPESYRKFLLQNNGGKPIPAAFPIDGMPNNSHGEIQAFFGLGAEIESGDLNWIIENLNVPQPLGILPIAVTPVGDYLCIDTLKVGNPVLYWDQKACWGDGNKIILYFVANCFDDLLNLLDEYAV